MGEIEEYRITTFHDDNYNEPNYYEHHNNSYNELSNHYNNIMPLYGIIILLFFSFCMSCWGSSNIDYASDLENRLINNLPLRLAVSDEEKECSICLDKYLKDEVINMLECGHEFHKKCLDEWFQNNNCPLCRRIII